MAEDASTDTANATAELSVEDVLGLMTLDPEEDYTPVPEDDQEDENEEAFL